jgi:OTU-like cysteine protease
MTSLLEFGAGVTACMVQADGNCMYHALAHQCHLHGLSALVGGASPLAAHSVLRGKAAEHITAHAEAFEPFIVDADLPIAPAQQMAAFCDGVLAAEWGSHVELQALSQALQIHIQARAPPLRRGNLCGVATSAASASAQHTLSHTPLPPLTHACAAACPA